MKPKTDKKNEKTFDTVKTLRAIKEKISADIADMDADQFKEYLKTKKLRSEK